MSAVQLDEGTERRFFDKVDRGPGCWIWSASRKPSGYGQLRHGRRTLYAHRVAYRLAKGSIPRGLCVLHKCDVRACVNPAHLFVGTHSDNMRDMVAKGRGKLPDTRGERHGASKLTDEDVRAIRADCRRQVEVAADYGVSQSTVSLIKLGRIWRHVPEPPLQLSFRFAQPKVASQKGAV